MKSLKEGAAIRLIHEFDTNNYYEAEDLFKNYRDLPIKYETAIRILTDLNLISTIPFNNTLYYNIIESKVFSKSFVPRSVDSEILKFKRSHLTNHESLLRQVKLLQTSRSSGEEDKLIELIDKWETVTKEVIKELYEHQKSSNCSSMKTFVKKLGLNWDDLRFSDESASESELASENDLNYYNNTDNEESKRIKYED